MGSQGAPVLARLEDDFGAAHAEFKVFAAHGFDEDGHLELAAALDDEAVLLVGLLNLDGHVDEGFLEQAVADLAGLDVLAFAPGERRGIDGKARTWLRWALVNTEAREHAGCFPWCRWCRRWPVVHARDDDDVAGHGFRDVDEAQALVGLQAGHARRRGTGTPASLTQTIASL